MTWIDPETGLLSSETCPGAKLLPFVEGSAPTQFAECGANAESGESWLNNLNPFNMLRNLSFALVLSIAAIANVAADEAPINRLKSFLAASASLAADFKQVSFDKAAVRPSPAAANFI